jgi:hypothetical protein
MVDWEIVACFLVNQPNNSLSKLKVIGDRGDRRLHFQKFQNSEIEQNKYKE